jgi:hypothetical protein
VHGEVLMMNRPLFAALCLWFLAGCSSPTPPSRVPTSVQLTAAAASGLTAPTPNDSLKAVVVPPIGWKAEPPKVNDRHYHQVWLSPSKNTAYGVIYFKLPFPVGTGMTLNGFINEMKKEEGDATLLEKHDDDKLPGVRFEAKGTIYDLRGNLVVDGWHGWVVYAGTIVGKPIDAAELKTAVDAREQTRVDLP